MTTHTRSTARRRPNIQSSASDSSCGPPSLPHCDKSSSFARSLDSQPLCTVTGEIQGNQIHLPGTHHCSTKFPFRLLIFFRISSRHNSQPSCWERIRCRLSASSSPLRPICGPSHEQPLEFHNKCVIFSRRHRETKWTKTHFCIEK